ncbi:MAG: hypothetical protein ACK5FG_04075 [Chryseotalea sp.]|nr:hypothetical protein [Cytophagales bacterium]
MTPRIIGSIFTMILIIGCETKTTSDQNEITSDTINTKDSAEVKKVTSDSLTSNDDFNYSDCIRGQAKSVTNKTIFPNAVFKLNQDNHTGTETLELKDRDKLIIHNWGCKYYVLTFRFETDRFEADTTNTVFWLNKATILMTEIENGLNAPLDIKGGINAIPIYLASLDSQPYNLRDEIVYDDDVIRDFVTLDRIQKISEGRFAIEISFATGPL